MKHLSKTALLLCAWLSTHTIYAKPSLRQQQQEVMQVQKLKQYDQACAKFDKKACQTLLSHLSSLCTKSSNAFACFRMGEVASINSEIAARQGLKKDSVKWLALSINTTEKACKMGLTQACTIIKIFKARFDANCKKGDQFFCILNKKI